MNPCLLNRGSAHDDHAQPCSTDAGPAPARGPDPQRVPSRRRGAQAHTPAGHGKPTRTRGPAHRVRTHAGARPRALPGQALRRAGHGRPVRAAAQLHRGAGRRAPPRRAGPGQPRRPRSHAHAAAGRAGHRQDPFRPPPGRAAGHRHEPGAHEFHDGRLAAVGLVLAMEGRAAGQGVRGAGRRRVRQPGHRGGRDRQGRRRRAVRPAGRALQPARARHGAGLHRRVRRGRHRRQPGDLDHHRQRRARHSGAHHEPHERVPGALAHARAGARHRTQPVPRHPRRPRLGPPAGARARAGRAGRARPDAAARDAARTDDRLRQRAPAPAQRGRGGRSARRRDAQRTHRLRAVAAQAARRLRPTGPRTARNADAPLHFQGLRACLHVPRRRPLP